VVELRTDCMEGAMQRYEIDKRENQWVVSIDGKDLLYCKERKLAKRIAKQANRQFECESSDDGVGVVRQMGAV
jgi:hypothetical protein